MSAFMMNWIILTWLLISLGISVALHQTDDFSLSHDAIGMITYSRQDLLNIRASVFTNVYMDVIPDDCKRRKIRKRGRRSGIRVKIRNRLKRHKPYVPSIVFGNVRSLVNKIDELRLQCRYLNEFRESCIIGITETWLEESISDSFVEIDGFQLIRWDRSKESRKSKGGGVALYINEKWCQNITVKKQLCSPDIELLSISIRPFYLPRELSNIFVSIVYIPPSGNKETAKQTIQDCIEELANNKPDALNILFGDTNRCDLDVTLGLQGFEQCVSCTTRGSAVLDTFFCNVKNAYKCKKLSPLKNSDHNMLFMTPIYCPKLKKVKPTVINKKIFNENSIQKLNSCFDVTDWQMFIDDSRGDLDILTEVVTSYLQFCTETVVEYKEIKIYSNNKPWFGVELRKAIVDKHKSHGTNTFKDKQKQIDNMIYNAKQTYRLKVESMFKSNKSADAWKGLKTLTGMGKRSKEPALLQTPGMADKLNQFYVRFEDKDFTHEHQQLKEQLQSAVPGSQDLSESLVRFHLAKIKTNKAPGPDRINGVLIKGCRSSLFTILYYIFNNSVQSGIFPTIWKIGEIVPIAKKDMPKEMNDFRPVTLTSILAKCLERIVRSLLMPFVNAKFDPLQFAYINKRSTDDATTFLLHRILKHVDSRTSNSVRALMIDYSSAFNCMQPHILINKLNDMGVSNLLQQWILNFLTMRTQYVRTKLETSSVLSISTGAPQGCALSAILFVLYTNDLCCNNNHCCIIKYADDTVIAGFINNDDDAEYQKMIAKAKIWCDENFLMLNVTKTKELIWDYRNDPPEKTPVRINNVAVEQAKSYKYLGLIIDNKLSFSEHIKVVMKKVNKRMYFVRTMKKLRVDPNIVALFFNSTIPPVLSYGCMAFYGNLPQYPKNDLDKPKRSCQRLISKKIELTDNDQEYKTRLTKFSRRVLTDPSHPLCSE